MQNGFAIDKSRGLAFFHFSGEMTAAEGKRVFIEYVNHPDFDPTATMITDARAVTGVSATFTEILSNVRGMPALLRLFEKGALSVILVSSEVPFGMARMLQAVLEMFSEIKLEVVLGEDLDFSGLNVCVSEIHKAVGNSA